MLQNSFLTRTYMRSKKKFYKTDPRKKVDAAQNKRIWIYDEKNWNWWHLDLIEREKNHLRWMIEARSWAQLRALASKTGAIAVRCLINLHPPSSSRLQFTFFSMKVRKKKRRNEEKEDEEDFFADAAISEKIRRQRTKKKRRWKNVKKNYRSDQKPSFLFLLLDFFVAVKLRDNSTLAFRRNQCSLSNLPTAELTEISHTLLGFHDLGSGKLNVKSAIVLHSAPV